MESSLNPSSKGLFIMINNLAYSCSQIWIDDTSFTAITQHNVQFTNDADLHLRPTSHPFHYPIPLINALNDQCECASS